MEMALEEARELKRMEKEKKGQEPAKKRPRATRLGDESLGMKVAQMVMLW